MRYLICLVLSTAGLWSAPLLPFSLTAATRFCPSTDGTNCTSTLPGADLGFSEFLRPHRRNGTDGVNASFSATAESRRGFFRLQTTNSGTYGDGHETIAAAAQSDSFVLGTGSLLVIPVRVTGNAILSFSAPATTASYVATVQVLLDLTCSTSVLRNGQLSFGSSCSAGGLVMQQNTVVDQVFEFRIPYVAGQEFGINLNALLRSRGPVLTGDLSGFTGVPSSQILGNFGQTGVLLPARVYDENGVLLTGVEVIGNGGLNYSNPPGAPGESGGEIPEPGSGGLVIAGLAAAVAGARRSRKV